MNMSTIDFWWVVSGATLHLGSHRRCSFILLSLHLQDGTASLYTIVIFVLSMFFHLFYVLSLAVFLFQIYAKKKILKAFLCYYRIIFWILVPSEHQFKSGTNYQTFYREFGAAIYDNLKKRGHQIQ